MPININQLKETVKGKRFPRKDGKARGHWIMLPTDPPKYKWVPGAPGEVSPVPLPTVPKPPGPPGSTRKKPKGREFLYKKGV